MMEIGVYINEKWLPAILTITDGAIIIKMETSSLVITLLEMANINYQDQYLNITYMERKNGEAKKKIISINADNLSEIYDEIVAKKSAPKEENNGEYVPPTNNIYNKESKEQEQKTIASMYVMTNNQTSVLPPQQVTIPEISDENKNKQEELNNTLKPKQKSYAYIFVIILAVFLIGLSIFMRLTILNSKDNLYTEGSRMWVSGTDSDYQAYKIYEDGSCKFGSFRGNKVSAQECKYTLNGHKITFKFEDGISRTYEWNIKCKISFEDEIKLVNYLTLNNEQFDSRIAEF